MDDERTHERLAEQISALSQRAEERASVRDNELSEIRTALADLAARVGAAERAGEKAPSWIAVIVGLATVAGLVGGLGQFVINTTVSPINHKLDVVAERQDDVKTRLARIEGELPMVRERLEDVDTLGSRKWVQRD